MTMMVIDEGDFDPGETTYLIAKSAPNEKKSESPDRNMFATAKVYFKRVAPFIYVAVLSYIAGGMKSKPSVAEVPIVDIANLEPLRSSSKIPVCEKCTLLNIPNINNQLQNLIFIFVCLIT